MCRHLSYSSTSLARSRAGHTSAISLSPTQCQNIIDSRDKRVKIIGIAMLKNSFDKMISPNVYESIKFPPCCVATGKQRTVELGVSAMCTAVVSFHAAACRLYALFLDLIGQHSEEFPLLLKQWLISRVPRPYLTWRWS